MRQALDTRSGADSLNAIDRSGYTPLMHAVMRPAADPEMVRLLLEHGANPNEETRQPVHTNLSVMACALRAGDPEKISLLLRYGADLHYRREEGYDALIDAVHGPGERLLEVLELLVAHRVGLSGVSSYKESGLRVLSRMGRFDGVKVLLNAGADSRQLGWTPLMHAVAPGSLADVRRELERGGALEERDWWERTPWLLAVHAGDVGKASFLSDHGADMGARGRCGKPPLFYAVETPGTEMLRWLLGIGMDVEDGDELAVTPLMHAVEHGNLDAVRELLGAGADVRVGKDGETALSHVRDREIASCLLEAGADPRDLPFEGKRALLGLEPDPDAMWLDVPETELRQWRSPRFGTRNPERVRSPFWEAMIRSGIGAWEARKVFEEAGPPELPGWCAQRFGQSITFLPDGRIVQIGGEHEDHYDPDFRIYNDVFVHLPDGRIEILCYPESVFPPTDFHTATLIGEAIYIIGSLGYPAHRLPGRTPVHRLDIRSWQIEEMSTRGEAPGWIHGHAAAAVSPCEIRITGGSIVRAAGGGESHIENRRSFLFDTRESVWREE